jgi:hypothetical protein
MFGNEVLRRIFGPEREEMTGGQKNYIMKRLIGCYTEGG